MTFIRFSHYCNISKDIPVRGVQIFAKRSTVTITYIVGHLIIKEAVL